MILFCDYPIIFSALDENNNEYFCIATQQQKGHLKWICANMSSADKEAILSKTLKYQELFKRDSPVYSISIDLSKKEIENDDFLYGDIETDKSIFPTC